MHKKLGFLTSISMFFLLQSPVFATQPAIAASTISHTIHITAIVPLSDLWASAIAHNTPISIKQEKPLDNPTVYYVSVRGLNSEPMPHEKILARITSNTGKTHMLTKTTDRNGVMEFAFTPHERGTYTLQCIDQTYTRQVPLAKQLLFTPPTLMSTTQLPSLSPIQIPINPPTVLVSKEVTENAEIPNSTGT